MEPPPGMETGTPMQVLLAFVRYFRPPTYSAMPYMQRLKADYFIFAFAPINVVMISLSLCFCASFVAIGVEIPAKPAVLTNCGCIIAATFALLFMWLCTSNRMGTIAAGAGIVACVCVPAAVIALTFDVTLVASFPVHMVPYLLVHLTTPRVGGAVAVLCVAYYSAWAYVGAVGEPIMVDMSSFAFQGICGSVVVFMSAAFHKTATVWHEASIAATVLEEATFEALLIFDASAGLTMVNHQFVELTGCDLDEVREPGVLERLVKGVDFASEVASAAIGTTKVIHGMHVERQGVTDEDGLVVEVPVDVLIRRIDTRAARVAVSLRDVSARVEMEAALRAAEVAEASARGKAAFLSTISHELRNPLNAVLGMTQIVSSMRLSDDVRTAVGNIVSATRAVLGIIHQLLDYGRGVERAIGTTSAAVFNLRDLVMDTLTLAMLQVDDSRVQVFGAFDPCADHRVVADLGRFRQVLLNLLSNAIKFTREGHIRVRVTLRDSNDDVVDELAIGSASGEPDEVLDRDEVMVSVAVEDTGPGIAAGGVEHVFGRYGRGGIDTKADYGGYGLGLAICRDLVGSMRLGRIGVRSKEGKGSTFWFTFAARRFDESVDKELSLSGGSDAWASGSVSLDRTTDSGPLVGSGVGVPGAFVPNPDAVSEGISYVRDNHAALVSSLVVHIVTPQKVLSAWVADIAAAWGFTAIASRTLGTVCHRLEEDKARDSGSQGPVSIVIVDAALKKELKENRATNKMRRLLPPRTPIALLHSIHDAAFAQSFADYVDGNLSTPLCEEKLIATLVLLVPVLVASVSPAKAMCLTSMVTTAEDSLEVSAAQTSMVSSRRRLSTHDGSVDGPSPRFDQRRSSSSRSSSGSDPPAYSSESTPLVDMRTLVVEDDALNLAVITKFLEMSGVTRVDTAADGAEGAEALTEGSYDFVLTDVHMPVMSGLDMIRTVAARADRDPDLRARLDSTYMVVLTGSMLGEAELEEMRAVGVRDTLQKPVMRSDLVAVLEDAAAALSLSDSAGDLSASEGVDSSSTGAGAGHSASAMDSG